jgi:hypothetical protein
MVDRGRFLPVGVFVLSLATLPAHATLSTYFGENQSEPFEVGAAPAAARAAFMAKLVGVGTEGFESYSVGSGEPLVLSFPGGTGSIVATITGSGIVDDVTDTGRFNTWPSGGTRWWDSGFSFAIAFSRPVAAFGFYGTDIGDFGGQVTVTLVDTDDNETMLTIPNTVDGVEGSALFWGFIDTGTSYKSLTFGNTGGGFDGFGFDGMTIGERVQVVPEPGTFALLALGIAALPLLRPRR